MANTFSIAPAQDKLFPGCEQQLCFPGGQPQASDALGFWEPPEFTLTVEHGDASPAISFPLNWPIDVRRLSKIQAYLYVVSIGGQSWTPSVLTGESLDATTGLIDTSAGKAYATHAIIAENAVSNCEIWRGTPTLVFNTGGYGSMLISQLAPGVRLGKYLQFMVNAGVEVVNQSVGCKIRGWYR